MNKISQTDRKPEIMTEQHYTQLIALLNEKIDRLEREKDKQRREINRMAKENRDLRKQLADLHDNIAVQLNCTLTE